MFHSDLAKLLDILSQLALGYSSIVLPEDSLTSILEIINHIFKQSNDLPRFLKMSLNSAPRAKHQEFRSFFIFIFHFYYIETNMIILYQSTETMELLPQLVG